jgi:hypothetical protein
MEQISAQIAGAFVVPLPTLNTAGCLDSAAPALSSRHFMLLRHLPKRAEV